MKTFGDFNIDTGGRSGTEIKVTCPQCSAARKKNRYPCLNVNTDKGLWYCWHCGWSGSLKTGEYDRPQIKREWVRPGYVENTIGLPEQVLGWFNARGVTPEVLRRNQIGYGSIYMPQLESETTAIMFPYFRGSECINIKYRDGKKNFRMHGGAERVLYGLNDLADTLIWVEGEIDKLSVEVAGYPNCVSVPDGAPTPNTKSYSTKFDYLDAPELSKVQKHIIAVDNDAPGIRLKEELTRRLGAENCLIVTWPDGCKDANEVLVMHGSAMLSAAIEAAKPMPIVGAFEVSDFSDALAHHYEHGQPLGAKTGWPEVDECYTVRPGEWTLVTGIPGHGKSEWLDALMINLCASQGWGFGVCSFENQPPELHLAKMAEKYVGKPFNPGMNHRINATEYDIAVSWLAQHVTFILPEQPTIESILDVSRQLVLRKGIRGLIIDPWNEIDHHRTDGTTETEYVSAALSRIRKFARDNGVHVFLVAHPTKLQKGPDGKYPVPTPYDVSGCHSADTDVLTMRGWVNHADVTLNDSVACFDLETDSLRYEKPTKIWEFDHSGDMYRFKSPSYDALVTPNHRMVVRPAWGDRHIPVGSGKGRPFAYPRDGWTFKTASEIAGDLEMPWASRFDSGALVERILGYRADLFLQFLGWWISEGWSCGETRGIGVCQGVGELADRMSAVMAEAGINFTEGVAGPGGNGGTINGWKAYIGLRENRELCEFVKGNCGIGAKNKKIPDLVWGLPCSQKKILLTALIEGDGSQGRGDSFRYSTTSKQLADDVQRLSIECGRMASVSDKQSPKEHHAHQYQVNIGLDDRNFISLRKGRNVEIEQYSGKVYCLTVPTGAYLVRRNGKPGIYGNSAHWRNKADNAISVWRDHMDEHTRDVEIHITKIRHKIIGKIGLATLKYDRLTGRYHGNQGKPAPIIYRDRVIPDDEMVEI